MDSLGFVAARLSSFSLPTFSCPPPRKSHSSNPCLRRSRSNKHHVPSPRVQLPLHRPLMTLTDGILNSYHTIIWVCPNHWLSPRLHLQSPTQLLSPTPTEVMWCTASHPSSVPPSRLCVCMCVSGAATYVFRRAEVTISPEFVSCFFFSLSSSQILHIRHVSDGLEVWSHHFTRRSWHVCTLSVCPSHCRLLPF